MCSLFHWSKWDQFTPSTFMILHNIILCPHPMYSSRLVVLTFQIRGVLVDVLSLIH
jgi:hypothetical protein